jgi:lipopolysaccharide export system protein LptC
VGDHVVLDWLRAVPGPNFATLFGFLAELGQPNKEFMLAFRNESIGAIMAEAEAAFSAGAAPPPDREQAFAKARRRSALVRRLRSAILIGGFGTVAVMFVFAFFSPFSTKLGSLVFSTLSVDGTKIVMDRPKLAGFRNDGQAYSLTAKRALQDIKHPAIIELETVQAEIGATNGEPTHVTADSGVYDSVGENMELSDNVRITNGGTNVLLRSAKFDFKSGAYRSDEPIEVHVSDGTTIVADRAFGANHGQELTFDGHVKTRIVPQAGQQAPPTARGTNP